MTSIRNNWTREEIAAIYNMPVLELMYKAATVHRDTDGAFTWREGSLYPSLHKLEQAGLIVGEWEERETGRKRRYYRLTKLGRAALREKEQAWAALGVAVNQVLAKSRDERG